jgi:hypothetical protein
VRVKASPILLVPLFHCKYTGEDVGDLPTDQCPRLTNFTFDPADTPENELPVTIALGYVSPEAKGRFFANMATRMAGGTIPRFVHFHLYDATKDKFLEPIHDGTIVASPPCFVNIEAVIRCGTKKKVIIELKNKNGAIVKKKRERSLPYFLFGNVGRNISSGVITPGNYTITARSNGKTSEPISFTMGKCV